MLGTPFNAFLTIVAVDIWQWTPFVTMIFLAAIIGMPREPFEAAVVDGASRWHIFRRITLPMLQPIIGVVLLLRLTDAFKVFDQVFIMTGGGPGAATELLTIFAYKVNFVFWNLGYGSAVVALLFFISFRVDIRGHETDRAHVEGPGMNETVLTGGRIGRWVELAVIWLVTAAALAPFLWLIATAFKHRTDVMSPTPKILFSPTLSNFHEAFVVGTFATNLFNSLVTASASTLLCLVLGLPAAYAFSRFRVYGEKHVYFYVLTTRMAPGIALVLPLYMFFQSIGLLGTLGRSHRGPDHVQPRPRHLPDAQFL